MTRLAARHVAIFLTAALTATGCASYRLGPVNPAIPAGQAIEVGPVSYTHLTLPTTPYV